MAAEVDRFWTSGADRVDRLAFEIVSPTDLNKTLGWLDGGTGCKLTFGWDMDTKVTGSLDVYSPERPDCGRIRVHYMPRLGAEERDIVLCTCFASSDKVKFDKGKYVGSIELKSMLARYAEDELETGFTIGKNKSYKSEMKRLVGLVGGSYSFASDVKDKVCAKAVSFAAGKAPMEAIQAIADALGGIVGVNPKGVMTIKPYLAPAKKTCALVLPKGRYSVIAPEIEMEDDIDSVPNRVAYRCTASWKQTVYVRDKKGNRVKYASGKYKGKYKTKTEKKTRVITGRAQVSKTSRAHYNSRGRWVTKTYSMSKDLGTKGLNSSAALERQLSDLQKTMNQKAAAKLSAIASRTRTYVIECTYLPVEIGQVVEFERVASGIALHVQAMVTNIELEATPVVKMKITLRHVRDV